MRLSPLAALVAVAAAVAGPQAATAAAQSIAPPQRPHSRVVAGVPTTMSRCVGADCTTTALAPARARSGPQAFGNRFDFTRGGADALGLTVGAPGQAPLLQAALPWPA